MDQYETRTADPPNDQDDAKWSYQVLKRPSTRYAAVAFLTIVNIFLIALTFKPTKNSDFSSRYIPSWAVPVTVLSAYAVGALVALYIIFFVRDLRFKQSRGKSIWGPPNEFVGYNNRRWIIGYPELRNRRTWSQMYTPLSWEEIRGRLFDNAEARTAQDLRNEFELPSSVPFSGGIPYS